MKRDIPDFESGEEALGYLVAGTNEECAGNLAKYFGQGIEMGLSWRLCIMRAFLLHPQFDHGVYADPSFPIVSDEQAEAALEDLRDPNIPHVDELITMATDYYRLFRSWGATIENAIYCACKQASIEFEARYPKPEPELTDEQVFEMLNKYPDKAIVELMIDVYKAVREDKVPARKALDIAIDNGTMAIVATLFHGPVRSYKIFKQDEKDEDGEQ